ncbi:hypothetical protein AJ78_07459, partial [Emergomyces pasteurianus Ep9510]
HCLLGFSNKDENRGLKKDNEFLLNLSFSVECDLIEFISIKTLHSDSSLTLILNLILQNDLLKSDQCNDSLFFNSLIMTDSDNDSTVNKSIVNSIFISFVKQDTSSRATFISHSFKMSAESDEVSTDIINEHFILLKKQHQLRVSTDIMHLMITVKVSVIVTCLEKDISNLTQYKNELSNQLQNCKLLEKPMQCFEDNTIMFNTDDFCALSDSTDNNYHVSSEENDLIKLSLKRCRLFTQSLNT